MSDLNQDGRRLLTYLAAKVLNAHPGNPETYVSYKDAHEALHLPQLGKFGESLKHQGLNSLAYWAHSNNKPAITGLIIDRGTLLPGAGFFSLYGKTLEDKDFFHWWEGQIRAAQDYEWQPYSDAVPPPIQASYTASKSGPAERQEITVDRIVRDTAVAQMVKQLHGYKCQVCSHTIVLPDEKLYAEGHHIRPLGTPHNGPDTMSNILCVCPNHHVELDYGALQLSLNKLNKAVGHEVSAEAVLYHNSNVWKGAKSKT